MSLICSLAGHDWGETQKETEYDEGSDEIAVTEREFRVCDRCDERRIVAENTEVRAKTGTDGEVAGGEKEGDEVDASPEERQREEVGASEETEEATDAETDTTTGGDPEEKRDAAIIDEGEGADGGTHRTTTEPEDANYTCPDCDFASNDPSLRPGDICPDCGTGYIEET
jgi:DNA-directed RNA polymerase subunit RPC12/RpoP